MILHYNKLSDLLLKKGWMRQSWSDLPVRLSNILMLTKNPWAWYHWMNCHCSFLTLHGDEKWSLISGRLINKRFLGWSLQLGLSASLTQSDPHVLTLSMQFPRGSRVRLIKFQFLSCSLWEMCGDVNNSIVPQGK